MRIAGLGFRQGVKVAALRDALDAAGGLHGLAALATASDKAATAAVVSLANELGLPIRTVPADMLAGIETLTRSDFVAAGSDQCHGLGQRTDTELRRNARLVRSRVVSRDRTATAAIAEGDGP